VKQGVAQNSPRLEVLAQTDNDFFVPNLASDKNYSYGIFIGFRLKSDSSQFFFASKRAKTYLHHLSLGLMGYTPEYKRTDFDPKNPNDRPFAGWLYGEYQQVYIYNKAFFALGLQLGTMGEHSLAGKVQNEFHRFAGFRYVPGWETQVPNLLGLNILGHYQNIIIQREPHFIYYKGNASLGNVFTYMEHRLGIAFGKDATLFSFSRLAKEHKENAFFVQFDGGIHYTVYDATLQGNLFGNNEFLNRQQFDKSTAVISGSIHYLLKNWSFSFSGNYKTEVVDGAEAHRFGRITVIKVF
jgi:hypothetical protein